MSTCGTVIVTGACGGIGVATCHRLARDGHTVLAVDRDQQAVEALVNDLDGRGHRGTAMDLVHIDQHARLLDELPDARALIGLIHLAAVLRRRAAIDEVTEEDWDTQIDTNLKATFFLNRTIAGALVTQGLGGAIVNFASQGWWTGGYGGSVVYAASKGGVVSMSRGLARSLASHQIRVNVLAPGFVDTAMMRSGMTDAELDESISQVPLGRLATAAEISDAACFLIGPDSRYMTGATLNVSGGQLMY